MNRLPAFERGFTGADPVRGDRRRLVIGGRINPVDGKVPANVPRAGYAVRLAALRRTNSIGGPAIRMRVRINQPG